MLELEDGVHFRGGVAEENGAIGKRVLAETGFAAKGNTMFAVVGVGAGDDPFAKVGDFEGLEEQADDFGFGGFSGDLEVEAHFVRVPSAECRVTLLRRGYGGQGSGDWRCGGDGIEVGAGLKTGAPWGEEVAEFGGFGGDDEEGGGVGAEGADFAGALGFEGPMGSFGPVDDFAGLTSDIGF